MNTQMQKELERLEFAVADGDLKMVSQAMSDFRKAMQQEGTDVKAMLAGREARYGSFENHARISQALKRAMQDSPNWSKLTDVQKEGLEMMQHKVARMLNGDPSYLDNIVDIVGYSTLVKDVMETNDGIQRKVE